MGSADINYRFQRSTLAFCSTSTTDTDWWQATGNLGTWEPGNLGVWCYSDIDVLFLVNMPSSFSGYFLLNMIDVIAAPAKPDNVVLTVERYSTDVMQLSWDAPDTEVGSIDYYAITWQRTGDGGGESKNVTRADDPYRYDITGLSPGTNYTVTIHSSGPGGQSESVTLQNQTCKLATHVVVCLYVHKRRCNKAARTCSVCAGNCFQYRVWMGNSFLVQLSILLDNRNAAPRGIIGTSILLYVYSRDINTLITTTLGNSA